MAASSGTEAKRAQIKANLSEYPLGNNNPCKEVEAIEALLEFDLGIIEKRCTTNIVTKVSTKLTNYWKTGNSNPNNTKNSKIQHKL
jgi:hypothetical protein